MGFWSSISKVTKSIVRSPITKVVVGGTAVVFPAVGVPAAAGLAIANATLDKVDKAEAAVKAVRALKQKQPKKAKAILRNNARQRAALAKKLVMSRRLAAKGDVGAQRAVAAFRIAAGAKAARRAAMAAKRAAAASKNRGLSTAARRKALAIARKQAAIAKSKKSQAAKSVAAVRYRYNVGQAVRRKLVLTQQGRIKRTAA